MRSKPTLSHAAAALGAALALAVPVAADTFLFDGEHGVRFLNGAQGELTVANTGVATVNENTGSGIGRLHTFELDSPFATFNTKTVPPTSPGSQISSIRLTNVRVNPTLQGGVFKPIWEAAVNGSPSKLSAQTLPLAGTFKICLNSICNNGLTQVLPAMTPPTKNGATVGTGIGGSFMLGSGSYYFTFKGNPWTVGTTSVTYETSMGAPTMATAMGYVRGFNGNPSQTLPAGTLQLVTATQVTAVGTNVETTGVINRLTIRFQPEPGALALLGSGALALGWLGRRRLRR